MTKETARERNMRLENEKLHQWDIANNYQEITTVPELSRVLDAMVNSGEHMALDTETTGLDRLKCELLGFSFSNTPHTAYWVNRKTVGEEKWLHMLALLSKAVRQLVVIFANAKFDIPILERYGIVVRDFFDVLIGCYLINTNMKIFGLKSLAEKYLSGIGPTIVFYKLLGCKKDEAKFEMLEPEQARIYGCQDADLTIRLWEHDDVREAIRMNDATFKLEHRLIHPLINLELAGIKINKERLKFQDQELQIKYQGICDKINAIATAHYGEPTTINMNAPRQKAKLLYGTFMDPDHDYKTALVDINGKPLQPVEFTATGWGSTAKYALSNIAHLHEAPRLMLEASSVSKLRSSFTNKFGDMLDDDGKLRSNFMATQTSTGRFCSSKPNFQNIPKTFEDGDVNVRDCFEADDGKLLIDIDYSQIELRVAASLSREPVWMQAFNEGVSVHKQTAATMFGADYTDEEYKKAKTINFGILYGQTSKAFSRMYLISEEEAQHFIDKWMEAVPRVVEWIEAMKAKCLIAGYAMTYFMRRRKLYLDPLDNIQSDDYGIRAHWERKAISHIVQGTAADIMKMAIIRCHEKIKKHRLPIEMLLTVHDEILFQVPEEAVHSAVDFLKKAMTFQLRNWVPITVDVEVGKRWGSTVSYGDYCKSA